MADKVLLMGLPSTGKTTFLAALWSFLQSSKENKTLELKSLSGDDSYLNSIADAWLECSPVQRTNHSLSGQEIELNLLDPTSQDELCLFIPDFSGEVFETQFEQREWTEEYNEIVEDVSGVLLFVHSTDYNSHTSIYDLPEDIYSEEDSYEEVVKNWNIKFTPTQVILVDLLQFIQLKVSNGCLLKVGIIISAWDKVNASVSNPNIWLESYLPLLYQYVKVNSSIVHKVFGISAQGGEYSPNVADQPYNTMLDLLEPADRILIQDENSVSNDITAPLKWLMIN